MKYDLPVLSADDRALAATPELGADFSVYASYNPFGIVYQFTQDDVDSAEADNISNAYALPAAGLDLQLVCVNAAKSDSEIEVVLNVTNESSASTTATATFSVPSWVTDTTFNMPIGAATDFTLTSGNRIKTITGIASISGGAVGNRFQVVALPAQSSWFGVGCTRSADFQLPVPSTVAIPCGRNATQFVKDGRNQEATLSIESVYKSYFDGLSRMAGRSVSIMLKSLREDRLPVETIVIGGFRCTPNSPKGDGDDETITTAEGMFERFAAFVAK